MKTNISDTKGTLCLNNCALDRLVNFQLNESFHMQDALNIDPAVKLTDEYHIDISFPLFDLNRAYCCPKTLMPSSLNFKPFLSISNKGSSQKLKVKNGKSILSTIRTRFQPRRSAFRATNLLVLLFWWDLRSYIFIRMVEGAMCSMQLIALPQLF